MKSTSNAVFAGHKYAVVGAGLIGRLLAFSLAKKGAEVDLYDQGGPEAENSAARIAAAMLAPLAESAITEDSVVRMGLYSLPRWQELISELSTPVFFQRKGTLILWHHQDANNAKRFALHLEKNCQLNAALHKPLHLNAQLLREMEPDIADNFQEGIYLPNEGQLDNRQLLAALFVELTQLPLHNKICCHWNCPKDPRVLDSLNTYSRVIDCRGLGAKNSWPKPNQLRGVRGEVLRLHAPEVNLQRPTRLIHPRYPIYIAPKENNIFVVGATEIESEDLSPISVRSTMELLSAVYTVHKGFAEARILEAATQCRPTLQNNLPEIQIENEGIILVNGLYRHGFMIAPAVLDSILEILEKGSSKTAHTLGLQVLSDSDTSKKTVCA